MAGATLCLGAEKPLPADVLFALRVQPLFQEKCLACHGNDEAKLKGDYDMRTQASFFKGGESGEPAVVAGKPDQSPLYLSTTRAHEDDWSAMPPKENDKLSAEQLGWIKEWITNGAPWPDAARQAAIQQQAEEWLGDQGITVATTGALSKDWANRRYEAASLWAYHPLKVAAATTTVAMPHAIDALIQARLPQGVSPAPAADALSFIRRATYDLLGLPPSPEEVEAFTAAYQQNADGAVAALIERLLASPHYGERWARHWLDVVRYADTSGFANDYERGNAWRYRDYVVRAFNQDKPYDEFIREQIAGDEMDPKDPEKLIATGFLRMGPWELTSMEVAKVARQRFLDDVTNSVGETFLAHSLQCARCHDHKFDPVPTHDYYAMQAIFATTQLAEREAAFLPEENTAGFEEKRYLEKRASEYKALLAQLDERLLKRAEAWFAESKKDRALWDKVLADLKKAQAAPAPGKRPRRADLSLYEATRLSLQKQGVAEADYPPKQLGFSVEDYGNDRVARKGLERLKWERERYEPFAFGVYDGRTPQMTAVYQPLRVPANRMDTGELEQTAILAGGDPFSATQPVTPNVLSAVVTLNPTGAATIPTTIEGRRKALADWIASPHNPLTSRTIVNRLWQWHFGQPIAGNPNNFGSTGKKPTHPELLDWLANALIENKWSIKAMHRLIMSSQAYRRSGEWRGDSGKLSREELEKSYVVFKPRRLTSEEFRDAMLHLSGELNPLLGGIPNRPEMNLEAALQPRQVMGTFASAWVPNALPEQRHRRSLYALKVRGLPDPFMEVLNEPGPDFSCEGRDASTVTPQVFALFNGQASHHRALALAKRVMQDVPSSDDQALTRLFQLVFGRKPSPKEATACLAHWQKMTVQLQQAPPAAPRPPTQIRREAVEENTGENFAFSEALEANRDFVPDLQPGDVDARTRGLAEVCLVLLNSNEFAYVY